MSGTKAVFFDLDDTLYDHLIPFRDGVKEVFGARADGWDMEQLYRRLRFHSDSLWTQWTSGEISLEKMRELRMVLTFRELGIELDEKGAARIQEAYIGHQYQIYPHKGAVELISDLQHAGHVVGVITNGPEVHQWNKIRGLGLDRLIPKERIFISEAMGMGKPDAALFEHVNRVTGTTATGSWYIGDSWQNDVIGALGASWSVIWFNPRNASAESEHKPHYVSGDYAALREILL
ncbi:HAD family hydrolase [Paenibacillus sp. CAA11]|uniref:HAD family hydrolase n=1 Tax=Paenibacillus sp. CAA11 TaxID=1532905 RepID=UPI000D34D1A6|nr:HAD family hydrolase [Paenibacillus sp. CAA11]AWB46302.1 HAD family hydrolase [Paenibacillus sp. CAA11]